MISLCFCTHVHPWRAVCDLCVTSTSRAAGHTGARHPLAVAGELDKFWKGQRSSHESGPHSSLAHRHPSGASGGAPHFSLHAVSFRGAPASADSLALGCGGGGSAAMSDSAAAWPGPAAHGSASAVESALAYSGVQSAASAGAFGFGLSAAGGSGVLGGPGAPTGSGALGFPHMAQYAQPAATAAAGAPADVAGADAAGAGGGGDGEGDGADAAAPPAAAVAEGAERETAAQGEVSADPEECWQSVDKQPQGEGGQGSGHGGAHHAMASEVMAEAAEAAIEESKRASGDEDAAAAAASGGSLAVAETQRSATFPPVQVRC